MVFGVQLRLPADFFLSKHRIQQLKNEFFQRLREGMQKKEEWQKGDERSLKNEKFWV